MKLVTLIIGSVLVLATSTFAFRDGEVYRITSAVDAKVLTVKSSELEVGSAITLENWQDQSNQKWLAVEAVVAGDNYLLVPKRQSWDWNKFKSRGDGHLRDRHDSLPDFTFVLNQDTKSGSHTVSQQYRDSKTYQQWRAIRVEGTNKYVIKNVASGLCIKNPGEPKRSSGFFKRVKQAGQVLAGGSTGSKKPKIAVAEMTQCKPDELAQQWTLDIES